MEFVISDEKNYIRIDKNKAQTTTTNINQATVFSDYNKANNMIKCLKKSLKIFNWNIVEKSIEKATNEENTEQDDTDTYMATIFDDNETDWMAELNHLSKLSNELKQYRINLYCNLKRIDSEINDLQHYIEFYNFSASKGFQLCKMLKDCRIKRRKIKDEILRVSIVIETSSVNVDKDRAIARMNGIDNRVYAPRALLDLFLGV